MYNLGCLYGRADRNQEALLMLENSFEMRQRILPASHPEIGNEFLLHSLNAICFNTYASFVLGDTMMALGTIYNNLGRRNDAVAMLNRTLEFRKRVLPADHPSIAQTQLQLQLVKLPF